MGTTVFYEIRSRDAMVAHLRAQIQPPHAELIRSSVVGNHHWYVARLCADGKTFIGLDLMSGGQDGWGYKGLSECMGPGEYDCPLAFLDLAPPDGEWGLEWRAKVQAYHAAKRTRSQQLKPGADVRYGGQLYTLIESAGPHRGWIVRRADGVRFRMGAAQLRDATFVDTPPPAAQAAEPKPTWLAPSAQPALF